MTEYHSFPDVKINGISFALGSKVNINFINPNTEVEFKGVAEIFDLPANGDVEFKFTDPESGKPCYALWSKIELIDIKPIDEPK